MNTVVHRIGYLVVERNPVGRIADYSNNSALFVGTYRKRAYVYTMIDEAERWNAPHPKFTSSGGRSHEVLHYLRHIFFKHQKDNQKKVLFIDEVGNRFFLFMLMSGDVLVGTENSGFEPGAVASFGEGHLLYNDFATLRKVIDDENQKNQEQNPFRDPLLRERMKLVNLFP